MPQYNQLCSEFTTSYVSGLRDGNTEIRNHFATYFSRELDLWFRFRLRDEREVEDLRQETLCRALEAIVRENGLRDANLLRQFVNGICRNVLLEHWRASHKTDELDECRENLDEAPGPEQVFRVAENISHLRTALMSLPANDRTVLTMLYFEELDRSEITQRIGINRGHLRVLVHRAISRLRVSFVKCPAEKPENTRNIEQGDPERLG